VHPLRLRNATPWFKPICSDNAQNSDCETPVIVVTGTGDTALLAGADRDNVATILKKPVSPDVLLAAVSEALG